MSLPFLSLNDGAAFTVPRVAVAAAAAPTASTVVAALSSSREMESKAPLGRYDGASHVYHAAGTVSMI